MWTLSAKRTVLNQPAFIVTAGIVQIVLSIALIVFASPVGVAFCRLGKKIVSLNHNEKLSSVANTIYDEQRVPKIFRWFGVFGVACAVIITPIRLFFAS